MVYIDGTEQIDLENQLEVTFDRPDDDAMTTYSCKYMIFLEI